MSDPWSFGVEPLPDALDVAPLLRRVAGLVLALEHGDPAVTKLVTDLQAAEAALTAAAPRDLAPRVGADPPTAGRAYIDHSRDIGAFNPCFPEYYIHVDGDHASGTVTFPIAFEGPPGVVHGGVLATFFDCAIQHHHCDAGVAGKTTSLLVEYRRPAPVGVPVRFTIDREVGARRITSHAKLTSDDTTLCTATMEAVAGDRARLPAVSPRRHPS
jgi:acyl-coenzyme A thioesterase PaaI-like protein